MVESALFKGVSKSYRVHLSPELESVPSKLLPMGANVLSGMKQSYITVWGCWLKFLVRKLSTSVVTLGRSLVAYTSLKFRDTCQLSGRGSRKLHHWGVPSFQCSTSDYSAPVSVV